MSNGPVRRSVPSPPAVASRSLRKSLIVGMVVLGMITAALVGWRFARVSAPVNGPVILISIDTLRADHLPVYGYKGVQTPNIDRLAKDAVVFTHAYSHAPQTLPAHTSILSGRLPYEHGVRDNIGFAVKKGERLLPQLLRERGYSTAGVVSAYVLRRETGINQGFDFFDSDLPPASPELSFGQVQRDGTESESVAERWMNALGSQRFFLFLHLYEPHKPYTPPARFAQYAPYDGEIAYSDEIVGKLIDYLKARQLYEKSTIILISDHGEGLGDHGEQEHGLFLYDEAIRVAMIVKPPAGTAVPHRDDTPVQHIDLVPTVLDLVKAPRPGGLQGRSLRPLLEGTGKLPEQGIYAEALYSRYHFGWSELFALTDARYRYIKAPREELYDLERDGGERTNIAPERAQAAQAMRGALDRLLAGATIQAPAEIAAEDRERLQALGYVGAQTVAASVPGSELPDPKDKLQVLETYRRATELAGQRQFGPAIDLMNQILVGEPQMSDVVNQLATLLVRADRMEEAAEAYRKFIELKPEEPGGYLGAAAAYLKLKKLDLAREHAELGIKMATEHDVRTRGSAWELLTKIALARHDVEGAKAAAEEAAKADPGLPLPTYIEGRLLYDQGKYAEALPLFELAVKQSATRTVQLTELHFYTGDTLARLDRPSEAEQQFVEEITLFPQNSRARAGLAMLYRSMGRDADAERAIANLLSASPTPEGYALAIRVWNIFGERAKAEALRAEARKLALAQPARRPATRR